MLPKCSKAEFVIVIQLLNVSFEFLLLMTQVAPSCDPSYPDSGAGWVIEGCVYKHKMCPKSVSYTLICFIFQLLND